MQEMVKEYRAGLKDARQEIADLEERVARLEP